MEDGSQWETKLFGYQHASKYLLLCYTEERRFEQHDNELNFAWTFPLSYNFSLRFS